MFFNRLEPFLNSSKDNIGTNLLTKFHEDPTINVASTVLTRQIFMTHNGRQTIDKSFELSRGINGTNVLTKFHDDWTINVASRVFTRQNVDDARRTKGDHKSSP
ncbi:hypothetical protein DPMN_016557 [Dreissena polymorpha]|uniref:Uncharacterized protein n=1 Tax=Dreissena polymorpha TaxID=45954 RepID=A0A9D4S4P4_DREPO|nr:hypothetical protein DPMN_016557 [Dreissena polymorpha]